MGYVKDDERRGGSRVRGWYFCWGKGGDCMLLVCEKGAACEKGTAWWRRTLANCVGQEDIVATKDS